MSGASSAAPKRITVTIPAATVTLEARKLARRSLSLRRWVRVRSGPDALSGAAISLISIRPAIEVNAQARVHGHVDEIDDEVDDHEQRRDQHEIGGHDRNVDVLDRLQEELAHARPGEHRFGDDGEGDDRAELEADNGDHRDQGILERVAEMVGARERSGYSRSAGPPASRPARGA